MRRISLFLIVCVFLSLPASAKIVEMIAAKVNGEIITLSELENELGQVGEQVEQKKMLNLLIENKIILQNARKAGIEVAPSEINRCLEEAIGNVKAELRWEYKSRIEEELIIQRYVEQEVRSKIEVSQNEIDAYFERQREEVRARHILLKTEEEAMAVLNQIKAGADFDKLAKEKSQGPSAEKGGDLGYFRDGDMVPEFSDAVFQMKKGEVSGPVQTQFGYHVIKLEDRRTIELEEVSAVKENIKNKLLRDKMEKAYFNWIDKLKKEASIEIKL